jgi:hypothetical protein
LWDSQLLLETNDLASKGSVLLVTTGTHISIFRA